MNDSIKKVNPTPEDHSPKDKPEILSEAQTKTNDIKNSLFERRTTAELIMLDEEIKVVGLSFVKCKETNFLNVNGWLDMYDDRVFAMLDNIAHVKDPETGYSVYANSDIIQGDEVTDVGGQDELYEATIVPAGRYLKVSWNAENFEELVMEAMGGDKAVVEAFLKENNLEKTHGDDGFYVEVYPKNTTGKEMIPITPYPEMYTLQTVKDKELQ